MHNAVLMAVIDAGQQLFHNLSGIRLAQIASPDYFIKQLPTLNDVSDDVKPQGVLKVFIDLDNVRVVKMLQDRHLVKELFSVQSAKQILLYDFDRAMQFHLSVLALPHLSKSALSDNLAYLVDISERPSASLDEHALTYQYVAF
jgi:hypothetical protein